MEGTIGKGADVVLGWPGRQLQSSVGKPEKT
jgi:hypothetical protein